MIDLKGKTALITGGSRGIGASICNTLSKIGCDIVFTYRKHNDLAEFVIKKTQSNGVNCIAIKCDLNSKDSIDNLMHSLNERNISVDILINNAGCILRSEPFPNEPYEDIETTIRINLTAIIYLSGLLLPKMEKKLWGRVINIGSTYGRIGATGVLSYAAAKAGIEVVTKSLARDFGKFGITVNSILPGNILTDMTKSAGKEFMEKTSKATPVGRLGLPEEVSQSVAHLIKSDFINGHGIVVDGGHSLCFVD